MKIGLSLLVVVFLGLFLSNMGGLFSSGYFFCRTHEACIHEIAHKMDFENGHPSDSEEFSHAVTLYIMVEFHKARPSDLSINMVGFMSDYKGQALSFSSTPEELYAMIYQWTGGNVSEIPDGLQKFYNRDERYKNLYDCLTTGEQIKICGRGIYISN